MTLHVQGPVGADSGWVMDFADLTEAFKPIHAQLDHYYLNEIEGLSEPHQREPRAVDLAARRPRLPRLSQVMVRETCTSGCIYRGEND